jgi:hypothetical protein
MGHFVSVEQVYVWRSQQVGSGQFFSTKLSGYHVVSYLRRLTHSEVELGPFEKITFSEEDSLTRWWSGSAYIVVDGSVPMQNFYFLSCRMYELI